MSDAQLALIFRLLANQLDLAITEIESKLPDDLSFVEGITANEFGTKSKMYLILKPLYNMYRQLHTDYINLDVASRMSPYTSGGRGGTGGGGGGAGFGISSRE